MTTSSPARRNTSRGPAAPTCSASWLAEQGIGDVERLPHTVKILLENLLRRAGTPRRLRRRRARARRAGPTRPRATTLAFMPARVLMQDFTGVPAVVDLAAMRERDGAGGRRPGDG